MARLLAVAGVVTAAVAVAPATGAGAPAVPFRVFARTGLRLTDVVWTGRQFLYVDNTSNRVAAAGPSGAPLRAFAQMPRQVEETRCAVASGAHGFAAGYLYCHSPDNKIYRISPDGKSVTTFARLPTFARSDGALTFDTVGAFGYALLAATGRSGGAAAQSGNVFAIDHMGQVRRVGGFQAHGGADEMAVAPPGFGSAAGEALLAVDAGKSGSLLALDAHGRGRLLATFPDGPNPLATLVSGQAPRAGTAPSGLYIADTLSHAVYFAPAAALRTFAGAVIVGSELRGLFWVVRPHGGGFTAQALRTTLAGHKYNFEAALYLAG